MNRPTLMEIKSASSVIFGIDVFNGASGKYRGRSIVRMRQVSHYVAHSIFKHSQSKTGEVLGNKDHATVLYSCKVIRNEMKLYPDIKELVNNVKLKSAHKTSKLERSPVQMLTSMLKYSNLSIFQKIELRELFKALKNESN